MLKALRGLVRFVRWVLTPEDLDRSVPPPAGPPSSERAGFLRGVLRADALDAVSADAPPPRREPGLLRFVFEGERLDAGDRDCGGGSAAG